MNWLEELSVAIRKDSQPIPKGWFCLAQESKRTGISRTRMKEHLADAIRLGILERKKFRVHNGKAFRWIYYYHKK